MHFWQSATMFDRGALVRFFYLWHRQAIAGEETGRKSRPVCVLLQSPDNPAAFFLFPITSKEPTGDQIALLVPEIECRRGGIAFPSWIVVDEYNRVNTEELYDFDGLETSGAFSTAFLFRIGESVKQAAAEKRLKQVRR